jgi:hypothetical protein
MTRLQVNFAPSVVFKQRPVNDTSGVRSWYSDTFDVVHMKVKKGKVVPLHSMKACEGNKGHSSTYFEICL